MSQFRGNPSRDRTNLCGGPHLGELSGGNWMAYGGLFLTELVSSGSDISIQFDYPYRFLTNFRSLLGNWAVSGCFRAPGMVFKIVTWLILPVVICLSQRLSHACLSISNYTVKLRMAH